MFDSLVIRRWVPDPSEIFIDSIPFGKAPPAKRDEEYLCSISLTVSEIIKLQRQEQIEIFTKILETIETVARIQKSTFKKVYAIRHRNEKTQQVMTFFAYFPKKFPFPR